MGRYEFEYVQMKNWMNGIRNAISVLNEDAMSNPHVIGDKSGELQTAALQTDKDSQKLSLDNNQEATVVTVDNQKLEGNISIGMQTILNGFMEAIQGTVLNIDHMTVNIGESTVNIIINLIMDDNQPITVDINSANQSVQVKYENFMQLTDKTTELLGRVKRYFNPKLMSQLQGLVGRV